MTMLSRLLQLRPRGRPTSFLLSEDVSTLKFERPIEWPISRPRLASIPHRVQSSRGRRLAARGIDAAAMRCRFTDTRSRIRARNFKSQPMPVTRYAPGIQGYIIRARVSSRVPADESQSWTRRGQRLRRKRLGGISRFVSKAGKSADN